jgi:hypothetical protein
MSMKSHPLHCLFQKHLLQHDVLQIHLKLQRRKLRECFLVIAHVTMLDSFFWFKPRVWTQSGKEYWFVICFALKFCWVHDNFTPFILCSICHLGQTLMLLLLMHAQAWILKWYGSILVYLFSVMVLGVSILLLAYFDHLMVLMYQP